MDIHLFVYVDTNDDLIIVNAAPPKSYFDVQSTVLSVSMNGEKILIEVSLSDDVSTLEYSYVEAIINQHIQEHFAEKFNETVFDVNWGISLEEKLKGG